MRSSAVPLIVVHLEQQTGWQDGQALIFQKELTDINFILV
jgi:hypothetical protein